MEVRREEEEEEEEGRKEGRKERKGRALKSLPTFLSSSHQR